jgi:Asp-tRNA(Asn)/Glu-tRNA(Gln) amidotransferase B subunit
VRETLARLGVSDAKQSGRVLGEIMKAHKGKLEPAAVKRILEEELAAPK